AAVRPPPPDVAIASAPTSTAGALRLHGAAGAAGAAGFHGAGAAPEANLGDVRQPGWDGTSPTASPQRERAPEGWLPGGLGRAGGILKASGAGADCFAPLGVGRRVGRVRGGRQEKSGEGSTGERTHLGSSIVHASPNARKSPGDARRTRSGRA